MHDDITLLSPSDSSIGGPGGHLGAVVAAVVADDHGATDGDDRGSGDAEQRPVATTVCADRGGLAGSNSKVNLPGR
jgi:hypothetical protein